MSFFWQRLGGKLWLPPQLLKPRGVGGGVNDGVLNVPVAEIVLDQAGVGSLIRQGEPASVAEHVGMGRYGQPRLLPIGADRDPSRLPV